MNNKALEKFINSDNYYLYTGKNKKKEIKKDSSKSSYVSYIKLVIDLEIESLKELFCDCSFVYKITFNKFNRKDISDMSKIFSGCSNLQYLNIPEFKFN